MRFQSPQCCALWRPPSSHLLYRPAGRGQGVDRASPTPRETPLLRMLFVREDSAAVAAVGRGRRGGGARRRRGCGGTLPTCNPLVATQYVSLRHHATVATPGEQILVLDPRQLQATALPPRGRVTLRPLKDGSNRGQPARPLHMDVVARLVGQCLPHHLAQRLLQVPLGHVPHPLQLQHRPAVPP